MRQFLHLWLPVMLLTLLVAGLIAGWWFVRNQALYGEPTGFQEVTELWGVRNPFESLGLALSELPYAWTTLWGRFGYGQIPMPQAIYDGLKIVVGAGLLGALLGFFRADARLRTMLLLLAAAVLLFFAVLFNYMLVSPAGPNGRFFFPALSASAILVLYGLCWWLLTIRRTILSRSGLSSSGGTTADENGQRRATDILGLVVTVGMLLLSFWVLIAYFAPAYEEPAALAQDAPSPNPINARFDSLVTLLGFEISDDTVKPGQSLDVELHWQVDAQPPGNYVLFMHLFDEAGTMVAQRDTHPGLGNYPTSLWQPGDRFVDKVRIHLPETAYAPETATVSIGLYDPDGYRLAVGDATGNAIGDSLDLAQVKIEPNKGEFPNPLTKDFANDILLLGYDYDRRQLSAGEKLGITLYWKALRDVDADYVMRFRLVDADGQERAVHNKRPDSGKIPTNTWLDGQIVEGAHDLLIPADAPPGRYVVDLTVVDAGNRQRVNILAADGHQVNAHLPLAELFVVD
jgi:hypothetical protein